jgi:hypothetical protein
VLGLLATATHRDRLSDSLARGRSPVDGSALGEEER